MKIVDLTDARWQPIPPGTAVDLPAVGGQWERLDMAEERVTEPPEVELSEAARELIAEAFVDDEPAHPVAEMSQRHESPPRELDWADPRWTDRNRWIELSNAGLLAEYFLQDAERRSPAAQQRVRADVEAWYANFTGGPPPERTVELSADERKVREQAEATAARWT